MTLREVYTSTSTEGTKESSPLTYLTPATSCLTCGHVAHRCVVSGNVIIITHSFSSLPLPCLKHRHGYSQRTRELISIRMTTQKHSNKRPESPKVTLTWHASKYKIQTREKVQKNLIYKEKTTPNK